MLAADRSHHHEVRPQHGGVGRHLARPVDRDLEGGVALPGADTQQPEREARHR